VGATVHSHLPERGVVEARFFGRVTREDFDRAFGECLELALANDVWLLLADCSDLLWSIELSYLKELVDHLAALALPDTFREAMVQPIDVSARVYVRYWETAGTNRGLAMRMFRDRDEALAWLEA
jgi:hypothetical protein